MDRQARRNARERSARSVVLAMRARAWRERPRPISTRAGAVSARVAGFPQASARAVVFPPAGSAATRDPACNITYWNALAEQRYGWSFEEAPGYR